MKDEYDTCRFLEVSLACAKAVSVVVFFGCGGVASKTKSVTALIVLWTGVCRHGMFQGQPGTNLMYKPCMGKIIVAHLDGGAPSIDGAAFLQHVDRTARRVVQDQFTVPVEFFARFGLLCVHEAFEPVLVRRPGQ